jgi:hypothetical protein
MAWSSDGSLQAVDVPRLARLSRRIEGADPVVVEYEVRGRAGTPFLHALHALLDLSPSARLIVPGSPRMIVFDVEDPDRTWPSGLDTLGPDDGTAVCALLPGCREAAVQDGEYVLRLAWDCKDTSGPGQDAESWPQAIKRVAGHDRGIWTSRCDHCGLLLVVPGEAGRARQCGQAAKHTGRGGVAGLTAPTWEDS